MIEIGSKVKLFLINSLSAEGTVELWEEEQVILSSNNVRLVINNPKKNIIMYYVFDQKKNFEATQDVKTQENTDANKKHFWEVKEPEMKDLPNKDLNLRLKKLAELKVLSAEAQREQVRKELTTFKPIDPSQILGKYGTPSFISPQHNTTEKIDSRNADDTGGLPKVPGKTSK